MGNETPILTKISAGNALGKLSIQKRGTFIKQFGGPPTRSKIVCFKFWELVAAAGCPFSCAYCFLQGTQSYVFGQYSLHGVIFSNWSQILTEVARWLEKPEPQMLMVGELQDGLAFDLAYKRYAGRSLTEMLVPLFASQKKHQLLFLTKSTTIDAAIKLPVSQQVVFSWSVNAEAPAARWEKGAPPPSSRIRAARMMGERGWRVRFRLDPMVPFEGWEPGYAAILQQLATIQPEMITLGALRASDGLEAHVRSNGRDASLFGLLTEKDRSGFKRRLPFDIVSQIFRFASERIDQRSTIIALCKEDTSIWKELGLRFRGCNCVMGRTDPVVEERTRQVIQLRSPVVKRTRR